MNKLELDSDEISTKEAYALIEDWLPVNVFCKKFPNFPEKTLKWQLTSRHQNGLYPYVQVIGKQRYISIRGYAKWLEQKNKKRINR